MVREVRSGTRVMGAYPDDALAERPASRAQVPSDGLVSVSPSLWTEDIAAPRPVEPAPGKRPPRATSAPRKPARSPLRWIVGGLALCGAGAGAALLVAALADTPAAPKTTSSPRPPTTERAALPVGPAASSRTEARPSRPAPEPAKPLPAWAEAIAQSNPWVAVAGDTAGHHLGLDASAASGPLADRMTGFQPGLAVPAPTASYELQQHEVSWSELEAAGNDIAGLADLARPAWVPTDPARRANLPATGVPWHIARAWCRALGGDLPSEAQWEWAARGPDARPFPWGDAALDSTAVRIFARHPVPVAAVGASRQDVTPGSRPLRDLLGNAQEWTRDAWSESAPGATTSKDKSTHYRAVRGWPLVERGARLPAEGTTYRQAVCVTGACEQAMAVTERVGFRCVRER